MALEEGGGGACSSNSLPSEGAGAAVALAGVEPTLFLAVALEEGGGGGASSSNSLPSTTEVAGAAVALAAVELALFLAVAVTVEPGSLGAGRTTATGG